MEEIGIRHCNCLNVLFRSLTTSASLIMLILELTNLNYHVSFTIQNSIFYFFNWANGILRAIAVLPGMQN